MTHVVLASAFFWLPLLFPDSRPNFSDDFLDNPIFATLAADFDEPAASAPAVERQPVVEPEPEPEPPPQPKPEPPPEDTPAAGDVEYSKRAEPSPKKEDPKPAPPTEPTAETGTNEPAGETERVGDSGGGVQAAGEISLFGWYQNSVSRALYSTWRRPILAGFREPLAVLIRFEIRKDGSVSNLAVVESSGVPALDRSALRAVSDASPLPRLPPAWRESSMTAAYLFELTPEDF